MPNRNSHRTIILAAVLALPSVARADENEPKSRTFRFHYRVTITGLKPKAKTRVWVPVATSNRHQDVTIIRAKLPGKSRRTKENRYGNAMYYGEAVADARGRIPIAVEYEVTRREVLPGGGEPVTAADRELFLKPNRLVPVGNKRIAKLFSVKGTSQSIGRGIYDRVGTHVRYAKPANGKWGRGDAVWVCDSRYGNCSDFHSLFIAAARSHKVPARFCIGFPIGKEAKGEIAGYHCWAEFADGKRWSPVDASEASKQPKLKDRYFGRLPPDRVQFTTGRDLTLSPKQNSGPVNFLICPHVEVDGKVHTEMEKRFVYAER